MSLEPQTSVAGTATAAAPTYGEGNDNKLSLDLAGNLRVTNTGTGGGGPATIADGADVTQGALADAIVAAGATGSLSAKLRRLTNDIGLLIPTTTAAAGIVPVATSALATSKVIKASAGNLYSFNGSSTTVAGFFLIHNTTSAPAAGAVTPVRVFPVGLNQAVEVTFDPPLQLATGISITFTSAATPFTQTDSATAFISGSAV